MFNPPPHGPSLRVRDVHRDAVGVAQTLQVL